MATIPNLAGTSPSIVVGPSTSVATEDYAAVTVVGGAAAVIAVPQNYRRKTMDVMNTGTATIYISTSPTVNASTGMPLAPADSLNDQGGSYQWTYGNVPKTAMYVFATVTSRVVVKEGI